jgi:hypothetical protein
VCTTVVYAGEKLAMAGIEVFHDGCTDRDGSVTGTGADPPSPS